MHISFKCQTAYREVIGYRGVGYFCAVFHKGEPVAYPVDGGFGCDQSAFLCTVDDSAYLCALPAVFKTVCGVACGVKLHIDGHFHDTVLCFKSK